jgi:thiol-disulfide isomerase/thioredoxin
VNLPPPRELACKIARGAIYLIAFFILAAVINWFQAPKLAAEKITALELHALTGEKIKLQTADGKKTIVYFFAPWCGVCKISMDALNMFAGKDNLQAVAVGLDYDNLAELKPFQEKQRNIVYAGSPEIQRRFKIDRYPTVIILNGDGSIAHTMVGYTSRLGIWVRTLL